MSGPLESKIGDCIDKHGLECAAVLSGNRNFAGRIHPQANANILASPPLVVAYAIAGTTRIDLDNEPLGVDVRGRTVSLSDLWPSRQEIEEIMMRYARPEAYRETYARISQVSPPWSALRPQPDSYEWDDRSTYITRPPYLEAFDPDAERTLDLSGLRLLALLGDHVTTDHISPSGYITRQSAAGEYLLSRGVSESAFNAYGTRRGCNEIVVRSVFASTGLENELVPGRAGSWTKVFPSGDTVPLFEAVEHYRSSGQDLIVIAGRNYGGGSSRDTAAKAPWLAGIRAVLAESFERIHRSNLVNMGIPPLQFPDGMTRRALDLEGSETFNVCFHADLEWADLEITGADSARRVVRLELRLDNEAEKTTFRAGGLLANTLRSYLNREKSA